MIINDFKIRTYGWQELAILYAPELSPGSAARRLSRWVDKNKALTLELTRLGWRKGYRTLTPIQVRAMVEMLGEP